MNLAILPPSRNDRRLFIGGSDARIIMGEDETALLRLLREKRGEAEPEDLSGNLVVQLGSATEELNRRWYERNTGQVVTDVQRRVFHPVKRWMAATLGMVEGTGAVFEAKFMLPWTFSEEVRNHHRLLGRHQDLMSGFCSGRAFDHCYDSDASGEEDDLSLKTSGPGEPLLDPARVLSLCFQRLVNFDGDVFERLGRYESALARQIVQVLFLLRSARRR